MQLPVSSYDNDDPSSTARLVNCYAEQNAPDGRSPVILRRCPGMEMHPQSINYRPIKEMRMFPAGEHFISFSGSIGMEVLRTNKTTAAVLNTYNQVTLGPVDSANDGSSIVVTTGAPVIGSNTAAYRVTWNGGTSYSIAAITDADFTARSASEVEFLDNYFLFREPSTRRFFGSDVGAPTAYTSTNFATKEVGGDLLVGMKATRANLLLFGAETIEIWDAVGGSGFPFRRMINGAIDKGCANGSTVAEIDDQVLWVADDRTVRILRGMEPVKISNFGIDKYLQDSDSISSGLAFTYTFAGHNYYVLRFSDRCFVYDLSTGTWHERQTLGMESWAWGSAVNAFNEVYFGRDQNPIVYQNDAEFCVFGRMDSDVYYEVKPANSTQEAQMSAVPMNMEWTYQPVWGAGQRVFHDRLEIVVQTGVGNSNETDPVISLQASDDGGQTWQSLPDRAMGAQGKTFQRVVWHNLGSSYQRVYRASCSAPVPVRVMSTELQAKGGRV